MSVKKEMDLFPFVKAWLEEMGCATQGEVNSIDVVGIFEDDLSIAVELKNTLNLEVICQAIDRQKRTDLVFIAVHERQGFKRSKRNRNIMQLLTRLNLGLLSVDTTQNAVRVVKLPDYPSNAKRYVTPNQKLKQKLLKEFKSRKTNVNIGGVTRTKLMTAYRENALAVAEAIQKLDTVNLKDLQVENLSKSQISQILQKNYYKWFERVMRGKYTLSVQGKNAVLAHQQLTNDSKH